jgi:hypothetical protein
VASSSLLANDISTGCPRDIVNSPRREVNRKREDRDHGQRVSETHGAEEGVGGRPVVGIDPVGRKHRAAILDEKGIQQGHSFSLPVSHEGYKVRLRKGLTRILGNWGQENLVVAQERSCAMLIERARATEDLAMRENEKDLLQPQ